MPILILTISVKLLTLGDTHCKVQNAMLGVLSKIQIYSPSEQFLFKLKKKHKLCKHRAVCPKALYLQWGAGGFYKCVVCTLNKSTLQLVSFKNNAPQREKVGGENKTPLIEKAEEN